VNAAQLINEGLPHRLSVRTAVIEPLSDDIETVEAMCDLADLLI
jgi:nitric oxide reductase NorQ protein